MKPTMWTGLGMLAFVAAVTGLRPVGVPQTLAAQAGGTAARPVPQFQVDPAWPKLPAKWVLGLVSNVAVDPQDHVWVLQRPDTVKPEQKAMAAPPVLEFDAAGNFVQGWGGPGEGYEWPDSEHGISVRSEGIVWLAGSGEKDGQLLKFTKDGKFVMQIGTNGQSKGNTDTQNMHGAADVVLLRQDQRDLRRRRVLQQSRHRARCRHRWFKRMWGAFGNVPTDPPGGKRPAPVLGGWPRTDQFNNVHSVRISNDGLVYVTDRANRRVQVFTPDGKYVKQVFISRNVPPSTLSGMALGKPISNSPTRCCRAEARWARPSPQTRNSGSCTSPTESESNRGSRSQFLEILGYFGDGIGPAPGSSTCSTTSRQTRRAISTPLKSTSSGTGERRSSCTIMSSTN